MVELSWSTAADHDSGQLSENVHHEQPQGTDWAPADTLELGYSSTLDYINATLAAYYPLSASSGSTAYDISGNGRDGTVSGPSLGAGGILGGNAYDFDGVDDYVNTNTEYGSHGGNFGVSAWVIQPGWNTQWENVFNNWDGNGWALQRNSSDQYISFYIDDNDDFACEASTSIVDGEWHHVHGQVDIDNQMEIWIDGTIDNSEPRSSVDHTRWNGNEHFIGTQPTMENYWGGKIAHVMVWHDTLTQSEIELLADPTAGTHTSSVKTS